MSGLGVDAQLAAAHGAIEARGWTLAGSVIDAGVSGSVPSGSPRRAGPGAGGPRRRRRRRFGGGPPGPDHPESAGVG